MIYIFVYVVANVNQKSYIKIDIVLNSLCTVVFYLQ